MLLREREDRLRREQPLSLAQSITDLSPVGLFNLDAEGRVLHANPRWNQLFGLSPAQVADRPDWTSVVHPEDRARVQAGYEEAMRLRQAWQVGFRLRTGDGAPRWLGVRIAPVAPGGGDSSFVGAANDITAMKELEMELTRRNSLLATVLDNLPVGLAVFDTDLRHVVSNRKLHQVMNIPAGIFDEPGAGLETMVRCHARRGGYGEGELEALVGRRMTQIRSRSKAVSEQLRHGDRVVEVRVLVMANGWQVHVYSDITDAQRVSEALEESQAQLTAALEAAQAANRAKSDFLATMSHELRTPLNAILGFAQVLESSVVDEEQRTQVRYMRETGQTLTRILNDILDVAKIEAGKFAFDPQPFAMEQVFESCASIFRVIATEKRLQFATELPSGLPRLVGDPVRLRQILHNLLSNAFKFTTTGLVALSLRAGAPRQESRDETVCDFSIEVRDTGLGMTPEQLSRVFERFEQAGRDTASRFGGTGLGLAIVRGLVERMGGTIDVQSRYGEGTVFTVHISLPVASADLQQAESAQQQDQEPPMRVLVVDDFPINRAVLRALLEKRGHHVTEAADGIQALEALGCQDFDLVLMDLDMPNMDGLEATRRIRALPAPRGKVAVHALTGKAFSEDIARTLEAGMDGHLAKPVQMADLQAALLSASSTRRD